MRRCVVLLCALLLVGCGKKEEPVETEPVYMSATDVTFDSYDTAMHYTVPDDMAFKSIDENHAEVVLNKEDGTTASIDYIQGNSLNDFTKAYYMGLNDNTRSQIVDDSFTTDSTYYGFIKSDKNVYVMVKGPIGYKDKCAEMLADIVLD